MVFLSMLAFSVAVMTGVLALTWPIVWLAERADRLWGTPGALGTIILGTSLIASTLGTFLTRGG